MARQRSKTGRSTWWRVCQLRHLGRDRRGNIAISAAAMLPIVVGSLALAVDFGSLTVQRRVAQSVVDLAALHAASDLARPKEAVLAYLSANGFDHLVETPSGLVDREGRAVSENATNAAVLHIETGRYEPDAARLAGERFVAGAEPANAARVTSRETGRLHFASIFADAPPIVTSGTAATRKVAAFSIGSRLASLEGGVLNGVIGGLLGAELSLSVMDYRALADVDVDMPRLMGAIAQHIGLTAVSYDRLLQESITAGTLSSALLQSGDFAHRGGAAQQPGDGVACAVLRRRPDGFACRRHCARLRCLCRRPRPFQRFRVARKRRQTDRAVCRQRYSRPR
jgi:uncharacterized membrane protein